MAPLDLDKYVEIARLCKYLPENDLKRLCDYVCDLLLEESNVQPVSTPVTVCGDIHGQQMVMSLRVSELQVLLGYAGRNKHGRKHELLTKALHLLKAGCSPAVQMKIKELYRRRFPQKIMTPADLSIPSVHSSPMPATLSPSTIPQLTYDGHPASSPLLPVSLLGPKHELELPHLTSALHPVHPDIKLQKLPFYDLLDELIKPTSLGSTRVPVVAQQKQIQLETMGLQQMVMSLRVSELQVLLGYAGRNKHGRKHELLTKALHLLKAGCSPAVQMKIKELYRRRFPQKIMTPADLSIPSVHSSPMPATLSPSTIPQLTYDGHPASSPLLPVSLLGPKHELELPHLTSALHPVHPDIKLQKLPFYDLLDELIKPTSLASDNSQRFRETCFAFALTPQQVQQISSSMDISGTKCDFTVQVQLRFCLSETSCPQEDHFPPNLCVKVNTKPCSLPGYLPPTKNGVEPKRPSRPINITSLVRLSTTVPNTIVVSWTAEIGRHQTTVSAFEKPVLHLP